MPLIDTLASLLSRASRAMGLETVDSFPPGHAYGRTRWSKAYFDIASDLGADQMESAICASISNTPLVFAHIRNPTPRMQRALLAIIEARLRRADAPADLAYLLVQAYRSPHTPEIVPGLRAAIAANAGIDPAIQAHAVLAFLGDAPAGFGVVEMQAG
ncbi:hypothetical protein [Massilia niastensis]|uniref:hypothetical protein n=1 Tax=Massilia niastensis TaxID=544911 RepID=UPI000380695A|nr:hypothetical protein [Massilia niastensis]